DDKTVNADTIEAAGKTILPGLIDSHIHLAAPGGLLEDWSKYDATKQMQRNLAIRTTVNSGEKLGAQLFLVGPLFTTPGGHGTEIMRSLPDSIRDQVNAQ